MFEEFYKNIKFYDINIACVFQIIYSNYIKRYWEKYRFLKNDFLFPLYFQTIHHRKFLFPRKQDTPINSCKLYLHPANNHKKTKYVDKST